MTQQDTTANPIDRSSRGGTSVIGRFERIIGRVPMYRFVGLTLAALLVVSLGFSLAGVLSSTPLEILATTVVAVVVTAATSWIAGRIVGARVHLESSAITGLLLVFLFFPTAELDGLLVIALAAAVAGASKFLLAWRGRHVFNPVAIAAVVIALTQLGGASWWVASGALWPFVTVGALLVLHRTRRLAMGLSFLVVAIGISAFREMSFGTAPLDALSLVFISYPYVFLAGFMLTEPLTTPPRRWQQILIAVIAGLLASIPFSIGTVIGSSPELALVAANLVAFFFGQRRSVRLSLVEARPLGGETTEFVFEPAAPVRFAPGQYIELTAPHRADSRGSRRVFSLSSAPAETGTVSIAMRIPERASSFKRHLATLPPGTRLRATGVGGDFRLPRDPSRKLLLVAGGIGITPFASQLAHLTARGERRDVVVVYTVSSPSALAYEDVLTAAGARVLLVAPTAPESLPEDWTHLGSTRPTADELLAAIPDLADRTSLVSGPPAMVASTAGVLRRAGARRIRTDSFAGY